LGQAPSRLKYFRHEPFASVVLALEVRPVNGGSGFELGEFGFQRAVSGATEIDEPGRRPEKFRSARPKRLVRVASMTQFCRRVVRWIPDAYHPLVPPLGTSIPSQKLRILNMNRHGLWLGIFALVAMLAAPAAAQVRSPWLQVGVLSCRLNPSIGFIIGGHQSMECRFNPSQGEPPQVYEGAINTVGLDVGFSAGGVLAWAVFARTFGAPAGALAGEYVGVSGDVDIGIGGGATSW
jgi:Protein of unknown function (DUF992)